MGLGGGSRGGKEEEQVEDHSRTLHLVFVEGNNGNENTNDHETPARGSRFIHSYTILFL